MPKKIVVIIICILTIGCAHKNVNFNPTNEQVTKVVRIGNKVAEQMHIKDPMTLMIADSKIPNAWITADDKIYFTNGFLDSFDDDGLIFCMAHEMAHKKLGHIQKKAAVSCATTGAMMIIGSIVPGAGLLNYAVNPAVTNNYSKTQETEADIMASKACLKMGIVLHKQIETINKMKSIHDGGGGFFDQHPSWDDRITAIKEAHRCPVEQ